MIVQIMRVAVESDRYGTDPSEFGSEAMNSSTYTRPVILESDGLRNFVKEGGELRFKPFEDESGKLCWEMHGIYPDGTERPIYEGRTGQVRIVKTVRGLLSYWRLYHPEKVDVPLQVLPDGQGKI